MVIPKVGKDPVCYEEVIKSQKDAKDGPVQDGEIKTTRVTRKKSATEGDNASSAAVKPPTVSRRKAASVVATESEPVEPVNSSHSVPKSQKSAVKEVKTTRRTTSSSSITKKTATGRSKAKATK